MTARIENDVYFNGKLNSGGGGAITPVNPVASIYRLPSQVYVPGEVFPLKMEARASGQSEISFCTLTSGTLVTRGVVIDNSSRSGPLTGFPPYATPLNNIVFSVTDLVCGVTLPEKLSVYLDENQRFAFGAPIRRSIFFATVTGSGMPVSLADLNDGEAVYCLAAATAGDNRGGVFVYSATSNLAADGQDVFAMTAPGKPGRLLRLRAEVAVNFFRDTLSIYADGTGVARQKIHALGRGVAGAEDAWLGLGVSRGTDGGDACTDMTLLARDRQSGEIPFARARSFGTGRDRFDFLKPITLPAVATKTAVLSGMLARADDDKRIWYNDPNRGLAQILLSDDGPRARVANRAGLRALTPDGYQDGEVAEIAGSLFAGDGDAFSAYWASGSTAADNGYDVFKPNVHKSGAAWTEAGRFLALAPLRVIKFADGVAAPDVDGGALFQLADVPPAGGYTGFGKFRQGKRIVILPGLVDTTLIHAAGTLELPSAAPLFLPTAAHGGQAVALFKENGVIRIEGAGGGGGFLSAPSTTLAALAAIGNAINTSGKFRGKIVFDENDRAWLALGATASAKWRPLDDQSGISDITPA